MKNLGGRPTKYAGQESINQVIDYMETYGNRAEAIPTIAGLSLFIGVGKDTLYQWERAHEEFKFAMDFLRAKQESVLLANGLRGDFNSTIAKLILTKHGYSDKQEISGPEGSPVKVETWALTGVSPKKDG